VKYAFIRAYEAAFPVRQMCRTLGVSPSGYYGWRGRPPSPRAVANRGLLAEIRRVHTATRGAYGARKIWRQLRAEGIPCGRHRVARLRRLYGIEALRRRRFTVTTRARQGAGTPPDRVQRGFI